MKRTSNANIARLATFLLSGAFFPRDAMAIPIDDDSDGVPYRIDCDDTDSTIGRPPRWYVDSDGDGFGDNGTYTFSCTQPSGYVSNAFDCNDANARVRRPLTFYADSDGDRLGDLSSSVLSCTWPVGYVRNAADCDDTSARIRGTLTFYADVDGDGFGDLNSTTSSCTWPSGYVRNTGDCNDSSSTVNPSVSEVCDDGTDNDCNGQVDISDTRYCLAVFDGKYVGEAAADYSGWSVAGVQDTNGDGYTDILIGARYADANGTDSGAAYLITGTTTGTLSLSSADAKFVGEAANNSLESVAGAGDVDGDGFNDLLFGAPYDQEGGYVAGAAYLVYGSVSGTLNLASADAKFTGEDTWELAGLPVASAGDVNGDTLGDILVGAPAAGSTSGSIEGPGAAYIIFGSVTGTMSLSSADVKLEGVNAGDYTGYSVASLGDTNADGLDDVIIGTYYMNGTSSTEPGQAYLMLGSMSGTIPLSAADATFSGEAIGDFAGHAVSAAGDLNNDGYRDMLVGAYAESTTASYSGAAYVILGPVTADRNLSLADGKLLGETTGDFMGFSVASAGDVDGDSYDDFLVGGYGESTEASVAGATYLVHGPFTGTASLSGYLKITGEADHDTSGFSVSGAGDTDGDSLDDIIIGAPSEDSGGSEAGATYLIFGSNL